MDFGLNFGFSQRQQSSGGGLGPIPDMPVHRAVWRAGRTYGVTYI